MKGKIDLDSFLSWFENRMKNSSIQVSHTFDRASRTHTYVIKHDICENWSLYLKQIIEYVFNNVFRKKIEISTSYSLYDEVLISNVDAQKLKKYIKDNFIVN